MNVADIMTKDVKTVDSGQSFADVAKVLQDNRISSVIVMGNGEPAGIVTERDIVNLVAEGADPTQARVGERMTTDLATVGPGADITEAGRIMAERGIRHLPVVEKGKLSGIISIRDLTQWAIGEITGGHELPDLESSQATLAAAAEAKRKA
ncbi:MAG: CBS domain-containing protein [Actinomycetota bacterium]